VQKRKHKKHRNSAQIVVEANNICVKETIQNFEAKNEEKTCTNLAPCAIVVSEAGGDEDKNANRLSVTSISSVESSRSDNVNDAVNVGQGSSVFYVVWD
jgi:hypothetical protein